MNFLLAIGLALAEPGPVSPAKAPAEVSDMLPSPFTADEIRAGMPVGLVIDWTQSARGAPSHLRWTVLAADEATVTLRMAPIQADGSPGKGEAQEVTFPFEALRQHAVFPASKATRQATEVTHDVGSGPGWVYEVQEEGGGVTRHTFLASLPGAPVHTRTERAGVVVFEQSQVRRQAP